MSISTGMQVNEKIVHGLLKTSEIVKNQMNKFADKRVGTNSTMPFFHPVKRNKLNTFKNMNKVTTCKTKNATITLTATTDLVSKRYYFPETFNRFKISFQLPPGTIATVFGRSRWNTKKHQSQFFYHKLKMMLNL